MIIRQDFGGVMQLALTHRQVPGCMRNIESFLLPLPIPFVSCRDNRIMGLVPNLHSSSIVSILHIPSMS